jgi:small subunit ribosomal protein S7
MPPRLNLSGATRSLSIRTRPPFTSYRPIFLNGAARRGFANDRDSKPTTGPNQDVLPHVNEEAADMGKVMRETQPDLGQGTPIQEVRLLLRPMLPNSNTSVLVIGIHC